VLLAVSLGEREQQRVPELALRLLCDQLGHQPAARHERLGRRRAVAEHHEQPLLVLRRVACCLRHQRLHAVSRAMDNA